MNEHTSKSVTIIDASKNTTIDEHMTANVRSVTVTGLKQEGFNYLIEEYGQQLVDIDFFKCPLIEDLTGLESLANIQSVSFYWNQRATLLWDLSKNKKLKSVCLDDFTRLHKLDDLALSNSLESVRFGDRIWDTLVLDTLAPIAEMMNLKTLNFSAKKIHDFRIAPLAGIVKLEELYFPGNLFPTEKVAWLTARIGHRVKSKILAPYFRNENPIDFGDKIIDTYIIGKRKPSLNFENDQKRIQKYVKKFEELVGYFRSNPDEPEPD